MRGPATVGDITGVAPSTTTTVVPVVDVGIGDDVGAPASVAGVTVGPGPDDVKTTAVAEGNAGTAGATGADGPAIPDAATVASGVALVPSRVATPAGGAAASRVAGVAPEVIGAPGVAAGRGVAAVADGRTVGAVVGRGVAVGAGRGVDVRRTTVEVPSPGTMRSGTAVGTPGDAVASAIVRVVNRCSIGRASGRPSSARAVVPSETRYSVPGAKSLRGVTTTNWPFHSKSSATGGSKRSDRSTVATSMGVLNRIVRLDRNGAGRPAAGMSASVTMGGDAFVVRESNAARTRSGKDASADPMPAKPVAPSPRAPPAARSPVDTTAIATTPPATRKAIGRRANHDR